MGRSRAQTQPTPTRLPTLSCGDQNLAGIDNSQVQDALRGQADRRRNDDPSLLPIADHLNDPTLSQVERERLLGDYGMAKGSDVYLWEYARMALPGSPVGSDGLVSHLEGEYESDPKLQELVEQLSVEILARDPDELAIEEIWGQARSGAAGDTDRADSDRMALRAMAMLANGGKLPPAIPGAEDPYAKIRDAYSALAGSRSPESSVMSRGIAPSNPDSKLHSRDHNYHFFRTHTSRPNWRTMVCALTSRRGRSVATSGRCTRPPGRGAPSRRAMPQ